SFSSSSLFLTNSMASSMESESCSSRISVFSGLVFVSAIWGSLLFLFVLNRSSTLVLSNGDSFISEDLFVFSSEVLANSIVFSEAMFVLVEGFPSLDFVVEGLAPLPILFLLVSTERVATDKLNGLPTFSFLLPVLLIFDLFKLLFETLLLLMASV